MYIISKNQEILQKDYLCKKGDELYINMNNYSLNITAQYYDCDVNNKLKISSIMKYLQQTSSMHLSSLKIPPEKLFKEDKVFLLTKMCMKINNIPKVNQILKISTATVDIKGVRFVREFAVDSIENKRLISIISIWVLVNSNTHKILRPNNLNYYLPLQNSIINNEISNIKLPKILDNNYNKIFIPIYYSHLDINKHVNNTFYADFICNSLPYEKLVKSQIDTFVVDFIKEVRYPDMLEVICNNICENEYLIQGYNNNKEKTFAAYIILK